MVSACAGSHQSSVLPQSVARSGNVRGANANAAASSGMCSVYSGFGTLSFCYAMDEASGTTLVDSSSAGNNGTISSTGVAYQAAGLTTNDPNGLTTNGSTGTLTSGFSPTSGSFSVSFFVNLVSDANGFSRLAATGNPKSGSAGTGWNIIVDSGASNDVYANIGYSTGATSFGYIPLPLNTSANVTLTYNSSTEVATLCVGGPSTPTCKTATLPAAYVASGSPVEFGNGPGSSAYGANATLDAATYLQGTVLSNSQIATIAGYVGSVAPTPTPTPKATSAGCSYGSFGTLSFCYAMDEASGTTLVDGSGAGNNGTISSTGVAYHATGLTTNNPYGLTTNGSTGTLTSGYSPASGSFSVTFFVDLLSDAFSYSRLAATGNPSSNSPEGWDIIVDSAASNDVYANIGYGSGNAEFGYIPLPLNTAANVTLTYNSSSEVATLCVGGPSAPTCKTTTLAAAYVSTGSPIEFGNGPGSSAYYANATFDGAAYWQGTVLSSSQISTIASFVGSPGTTSAPTPTPTATSTSTAAPTPVPSASGTIAFNDWTTYAFDNARDSFNPNTAAITPASIPNLHLAWQVAVGNGAEFQPLIATKVLASHPTLLIVAGYETVHAYDALTGSSVWQTTLPAQVMQQCGQSGVAGTAVYDAALGSIFIGAGNGATSNHVVIYQLSASTGSQINSVDVTPSLVNGEATRSHTAITLANGLLYIGTGSNCEGTTSTNPNWLGRVVAVNPSTMTVSDTFLTTFGHGGNYGGGGVWAWGGVSSDANGNVYVSTGNAETTLTTPQTVPSPVATTTDEQAGYAEHLVKLPSNLSSVEDSNYPGFNFSIGYDDLDYNGVPVLFQPPVGSGCSDLLSATQGKGGSLVINDTTGLNPPIASYQLSIPSAKALYMGNPAYSPLTGYVYGAITSAGNGSSMLAPGLAAIGSCGTSIAWHAAFGPDSASFSKTVPRSAPTVTDGGVVFLGTPCTSNGSGGCTTPGTVNGALWAVDASSGSVLNSGNPLLVTGDHIRMAPTADAKWIWVDDNSGNLYGLTVDPSVPTASLKRATQHPRTYTVDSN